ncbi:MAG: hypothetical protein ACKO96_45350, partial [Flammeovirgaceae bacterium]
KKDLTSTSLGIQKVENRIGRNRQLSSDLRPTKLQIQAKAKNHNFSVSDISQVQAHSELLSKTAKESHESTLKATIVNFLKKRKEG